VEITKEFTLDVYNTVKRIHNNMMQLLLRRSRQDGGRITSFAVQGVFG